MSATEAEHRRAVQALIADPHSTHKARRMLELAVADPNRAALAREGVAPPPRPIPLELIEHRYDRHNLHMPVRPHRVSGPDTLPELLSTMQAAADAWQPMRAIGDGWGFANTGFTRGTLMPFVGNLDTILSLDASVLRDGVDPRGLLEFEAGTTIEQLNRHLRPKGHALLNQPGFEKLTFVGTMSSGGHGSGTWTGPLSSQVRSLHMVTVDEQRKVRQLRVEPRDGISHPTKFAAKNPHIELIQDDRVFHACTCAMGCLGAIYAVTVAVRGSFNIRETRKKHRWSELRPRLPQLLEDQGPGKRLHSIEVWLNPYEVDGDLFCVLGEREETDAPPHGHRGLGIEFGGAELLYRVTAWWVRNFPETLPSLMDSALSLTEASNVVLTGPDGLNFGGPNVAPVRAASGGIGTDNICEAADKLMAFFRAERDQRGGAITSPVGLRFCKAADAHLSPAQGRETCMVEVPILEGTPRAHETLLAYHDFIFEHFGGRPHWGQINNMPGDRLERIYPELDAFLEGYRVLNPKGFFDNAFTEQMGFRLRG